ncbi:MAG: GtrA family protein [Bacteroidaceae bacterium]|nr:GtrA family protein [Bacteroidaceae bacterium]MBR1519920.1 GtrA family protein [Bacteroidaceae bacterium]
MKNKQAVFEIVRFIIVGVVATAIHYGVYWLLMQWLNVTVAYSIGYAISFICNFLLTSLFTFRKKASVKRGIGFGMAHGVNYLLHVLFLQFFLWLGISKQLVPIPVFAIVIPINFLLVRFVFKKF